VCVEGEADPDGEKRSAPVLRWMPTSTRHTLINHAICQYKHALYGVLWNRRSWLANCLQSLSIQAVRLHICTVCAVVHICTTAHAVQGGPVLSVGQSTLPTSVALALTVVRQYWQGGKPQMGCAPNAKAPYLPQSLARGHLDVAL
jgi:hypothetical protein